MRTAPLRWAKAIATLAVTGAALTATGPRVAGAGRTHFGWLRGADVVPERAVELETWIFEKNGVGDDGEVDEVPDETAVWWTAVVGITDRIELGLPIEIRHTQVGDTDGLTLLYAAGAEVRWRLVSPDPVEAGPLAPALRIGVHRLINARSRTRGDAGLAIGADLGSRVHAAVDLGATWIVGEGESLFELTPAAGVSIRIIDELRVGAEAYSEVALRGQERDWLAAGPNLAWTHGRFWMTAALPIGLIDISTAPRINWAVAF
jgi:hypothetical protein